jgi:hypothetical protein
MGPPSLAGVAELPLVVFVAPDAEAVAVAAELVERLKDVARVQVVTDISEVPADLRAQADAFPVLPREVFELVAQLPLECPDLVALEPPLPAAGYGPPRRGRKGKPLRW